LPPILLSRSISRLDHLACSARSAINLFAIPRQTTRRPKATPSLPGNHLFAAKQQSNSQSRAAGVSPPWCVRRTAADDNRTMLAGSRTRNRERRDVSPPWRCNAIATGSAYHGWLTPAAPGCTTFVRNEKRHSRCTNARSQERRASARRGNC
jgi:hypothetical protein